MQRQVVGFASPAQDMIADNFTLDRYLVPHPLNTMYIEMTGDSMRGVVNSGDVVIVERGVEARPGQIVLAQLDGQYLIRFLGRDRQGPFLYGTRRGDGLLRPTADIAVTGIVTGLARRFAPDVTPGSRQREW